MANLIIKPTSGGSLILQDEGGTAAHTIDASGNHTLANTTTLANATITAGTFPTGHVIQMKYKQHHVSGHHHLSSSSGWVSHGDEADLKFNFTPKQSSSTLVLELSQPTTHGSTGGGWGMFAFTKDGSKTGWGVGEDTDVNNYGHFRSGLATHAGLYHALHGRLIAPNTSTSTFEVGIDVKWGAGAWYYAHADGFSNLSITEYAGVCAA